MPDVAEIAEYEIIFPREEFMNERPVSDMPEPACSLIQNEAAEVQNTTQIRRTLPSRAKKGVPRKRLIELECSDSTLTREGKKSRNGSEQRANNTRVVAPNQENNGPKRAKNHHNPPPHKNGAAGISNNRKAKKKVRNGDTTEMKIIAINSQSTLHTNSTELETFVTTHRPDVLFVAETGLDEYSAMRFQTPGGYTASHLYPKGGTEETKRRSISVFVADKWITLITPANMQVEHNRELCAIHFRIQLKKWNLLLVGAYGKSADTRTYWDTFRNWIEKNAKPADRVVIIGDLNVAPQPQRDRYTPEGSERAEATSQTRALREMCEAAELIDIWREKHPHKIEFTWHALRKLDTPDTEIPKSRIDLALISLALREHIPRCEILDELGTLTPDHRPIALNLILPEPITNMEQHPKALPEISRKVIDVKKLQEADIKEKYQQSFTGTVLEKITAGGNAKAQYNRMQNAIITIAKRVLGQTAKISNCRRKPCKPTRMDLLRGYCTTVSCSEMALLTEVKNGSKLRQTAAIARLLEFKVDGYQIPPLPDTTDVKTAVEWFRSVDRIAQQCLTAIQQTKAPKRAQKIIDAIERRDDAEIHNPKKWYQAVRMLKATQTRKVQRAVINEVDPKQTDTPEFERPDAVNHKLAVRKYYEFAYRERKPLLAPPRTSCPMQPPEPVSPLPSPLPNEKWFTQKFDKHREQARGKYEGELTVPITRADLDEALKGIANGKATGPDGIAAELLKALPDVMRNKLVELFQTFLVQGQVPKEWNHCTIYTIHKGGDVSKCSNYRPISLQSVVYKTFMTIMTKRLTKYVEKNKLISEAQGGFRRDRTCLEKVEVLNQLRNRQRKKAIHIVFADVKKAYDSVPFDRLMHTLRKHQLDPKFVNLIHSIYTNNSADVITPYGNTPKFLAKRGLKQGCPMSPILFNLFLEPVLQYLTENWKASATVIAYADDLCIFATSRNSLQEMTDALQNFLYENGLELGISKDKSKTVYMTNDTDDSAQISVQRVSPKITGDSITLLRGERLDLPKMTGKESYKYLGVWWNVEGDWDGHLKRAQEKLAYLCRMLKRAKYTTLQTVKILNGVIMPAVMYGMEVIRPPVEHIKKWERQIRSLVNKKIGIHWNSTVQLHFLPPQKLGLGVRSPLELVELAKIRGLVQRGLNSVDKTTAVMVHSYLFSNKEKDSTVPIVDEPVIHVKENEAWLLPSNSLKLIFKADDRALKALRLVDVHTTDDLIDAQGRIHTHLRNIQTLKETLRRICKPDTYDVIPLILQRLDHCSLTIEIIPQAENGLVEIFTDASIQQQDHGEQKTGYAVHVPNHPMIDYVQPLDSILSTADAEAHGIAAALSIGTSNKVIVYTDSKVTKDRLDYIAKHERLPKAIPLLAREPLDVITRACKRRRQRLTTTMIETVLSHTDDKSLPEAKEKARRLAMANKFGERAQSIIQGNKKADELAKEIAKYQAPDLNPLSKSLPRFITIDATGRLIPDPARVIKDANTMRRMTELLKERREAIDVGGPQRTMYGWLGTQGIDWRRSSYLGRNTDPALDRLQNFAIKLRRGLIADKQTRKARQGHPYWAQRRYNGVMVKDDICDACQKETETRFHFVYCEHNSPIRANITKKVLDIINEHLKEQINDTPVFWAPEQRHRFISPRNKKRTTWVNIEKHAPENAAMGIIPEDFTRFLEQLDWLDNTDLESIMAEIQIEIVRGHHLAWIERCKAFTNANRTPNTANKRLERLKLREERRKDKQLRKIQRKEEIRQRKSLDHNTPQRTNKKRPNPGTDPP
jgi:exonuclease III